MKVAAQTSLPVEIESAWRILLRWEDQARWMKDADLVRVLTAHREGVGVRIAVKTRVLNVPLFTEQLEVTLWEPPRRLVLAHRSFVRGVGEWRLSRPKAVAPSRGAKRCRCPCRCSGSWPSSPTGRSCAA